jgi:hypothetical protein
VLGRAFGAFESLVAASVAAGSLVAAPAVHLLGIRGALAVIGAIAPLLTAASWTRLRRIDHGLRARDDEIGVLRRVAMLRPLPLPAIERLASRAELVVVPAGARVFAQGDTGDRYYVIAAGAAEVSCDGRPLRALGVGDGFGEIALLRDVARTATVTALDPLRLQVLHRDDFLPAVTGYRPAAGVARTGVDRLLAEDRRRDAGTPT